jgi:membrane-bound serine protease (ClpP class)
VLAAYGLSVLPTNPVGLALIVFGVFGFAIDVQTGVPRLWTGIGTVSFAAGSILLYRDGVHLSWLPLLAGVVLVLLMVLGGLPATVRSRFSTPTIGRESMVGEEGEVVSDVRPDGVVRVRGALWPAHTSRATPVSAGQTVRVVAIDGPQLQVEPTDE